MLLNNIVYGTHMYLAEASSKSYTCTSSVHSPSGVCSRMAQITYTVHVVTSAVCEHNAHAHTQVTFLTAVYMHCESKC